MARSYSTGSRGGDKVRAGSPADFAKTIALGASGQGGRIVSPIQAVKNEWPVGLKEKDIKGQNGEPMGMPFYKALEKYPVLEKELMKGLDESRDSIMNNLLDKAYEQSGGRPNESGYVVSQEEFEVKGMTFAVSAELEYFTDEEGETTTPMKQEFFIRRVK